MKYKRLLSMFLVLCIFASAFSFNLVFAEENGCVTSVIKYAYGSNVATELVEGKTLTASIDVMKLGNAKEENMIFNLMLYTGNRIVKADTCVISVPSGVKKTFTASLELTELADDSYIAATLWNNATEMIPVAYSSLFPKGTCDLTAITIDGKKLEGFRSGKKEYNYTIADGSKNLPKIDAIPLDGAASVEVKYPVEYPGSASITVTTPYGISKEYKINFVADAPVGMISNVIMRESYKDQTLNWGGALAMIKDNIQVGDLCFSDRSNANMVFSKVDPLIAGSTYVQGALNWQNGGSVAYSGMWKDPEVYEDFYTFDINQDVMVRLITDSTAKASYLVAEGYEHTVNSDGFLVGYTSETVKFTNMYSKVYRVGDSGKATIKIPNTGGVSLYAIVQGVWNETNWDEEFEIPTSELESLNVNGNLVDGFNSSIYTYNLELPYGSEIPVISAVAKNPDATVDILQVTSLPGTAMVNVSAEYTEDSLYVVNFTEKEPESTLLTSLSVNGKPVEDFGTETYEYTIEIPRDIVDAPVVDATAIDPKATVTVTNPTTFPGKTVVSVVREGFETRNYTINYTYSGNLAGNVTMKSEYKGSPIDWQGKVAVYKQNLKEGDRCYSDRAVDTMVFSKVDETLKGRDWIQGALNWQNGGGNAYCTLWKDATYYEDFYTFDLYRGATVTIITQYTNKQANLTDAGYAYSRNDEGYLVGFISESIVYPNKYTKHFEVNDGVTTVKIPNLGSGYACYVVIDYDDYGYRAPQEPDPEPEVHSTELENISADGTPINGFVSSVLTYNISVPYGNNVPLITATPKDNAATAVVVQATGLPGVATITVTAENAEPTVYIVNITEELPEAAQLSALSVNGTPVVNFDSDVYEYSVEISKALVDAPLVEWIGMDPFVNATVEDPETFPGKALITVTREGSQTKIYEINYTVSGNLAGNVTMKSEYKGSPIDWQGKVAVYKQNLKEGDRCYSDRAVDTMVFSKVDETLKGRDWIQGALNWQNGGGNAYCTLWKDATYYEDFYTFDLYRGATVTIITQYTNKQANLTDAGYAYSRNDEGYLVGFTSETIVYPNKYTKHFEVNDGVTTVKIPNLGSGCACYVVIDYDDYGYESEPKKEDYRAVSGIMVDGASIEGFSPEIYEYEIQRYNTFAPEVSVELEYPDNATATVVQADEVPGSATISISCDGYSDKLYTINFILGASVQNVKMKENYKDSVIDWAGKVAVYKQNLQEGNRCYSDRAVASMVFSKVDDSLKGKDWIQGALNWAYGGGNSYCTMWLDTALYEDFYTFDLYREAKVMIITDSTYRVSQMEELGWTHTHNDDAYLIGYTSEPFPYCEMYTKEFIPTDGPVTVNIPNMRGVSAFTVIDYDIEN